VKPADAADSEGTERMISETLLMDLTLVLGTIVALVAVQWAALPKRKSSGF